jgi:imidazolonepropionase-like amidohydrolase
MDPNPNDQVKLVNGRIIDVENGCYFPHQTSLVIQGGRILEMPELHGELDHHDGVAVIDLQGKTVIPGLFNTHCHLQFLGRNNFVSQQIAKNMADCIDRGITNVRDTLCLDLQGNRSLKDKIAHGEIQGPRIHQAVHVSPLGGTYAPRINLKSRFQLSLIGLTLVDYAQENSGVVAFPPGASVQQVRDAVDRAVDERGAEAIKLCDQPEHFMTYKPGAAVMNYAQLEASVDQAIKRKMPTTMHNVTVNGFRQGVKAGIGSLAHLPLDGELGEADVTDLLNSSTYIEPTLTVAYFMSYSIKGSPFAGHPEIQRLDQYRRQSYKSLIEEIWLPQLQATCLQMDTALSKGQVKVYGIFDISKPFSYYANMVPVGGENLHLLVKTGAASRLGCGNDAGPTNAAPASVNHELSMFDFMLNRDGKPLFTPADMLRTATIHSARAMGLDDKFGSLQAGRVADLVVLDGDPLQDYRLVGKPVQALFMDGRLVVNRCGLSVTTN